MCFLFNCPDDFVDCPGLLTSMGLCSFTNIPSVGTEKEVRAVILYLIIFEDTNPKACHWEQIQNNLEILLLSYSIYSY